jgi:hypothetical protein
MITCVIPTLYPAKPWSIGAPAYSGQDWYFGTWLFARFRGLNAREPLRGLFIFGMFQSILFKYWSFDAGTYVPVHAEGPTILIVEPPGSVVNR